MSKIAETEERQRIGRILKGEKAEYAYFVNTYQEKVLDLVSRIVPDDNDAEELMQDAFVKAYHALKDFDGRSTFLTWVQRIAYHTSLNHLKRRRQQWLSIDRLPLAEPPDEDLPTDNEERILLLETALDRLPPDELTLLHLYYYEDRPLREIAYIVDTEPNTLASRLRRIRKKLLVMMTEHKDE